MVLEGKVKEKKVTEIMLAAVGKSGRPLLGGPRLAVETDMSRLRLKKTRGVWGDSTMAVSSRGGYIVWASLGTLWAHDWGWRLY